MLRKLAILLPVVLLLSGLFASGLRAQQAPAPTQQTEEQKRQMVAEAAIRARQAEALAKRMNDPKLFARGESRVYRGENLAAISLPVGGISLALARYQSTASRKKSLSLPTKSSPRPSALAMSMSQGLTWKSRP